MNAQSNLKDGALVRHTLQAIEGRILGITRIRTLFEQPADEFEYRVQTRDGIKISSPANLEIAEVDNTDAMFKAGSRVETRRYGVQLCQ